MTATFQRLSALDRVFNGLIGRARAGRPRAGLQLPARSARPQEREALHRARVRARSRPQAVPRRAARRYAVGAQTREASGQVTLRRGAQVKSFDTKLVPQAERAPLLSDYLGRHDVLGAALLQRAEGRPARSLRRDRRPPPRLRTGPAVSGYPSILWSLVSRINSRAHEHGHHADRDRVDSPVKIAPAPKFSAAQAEVVVAVAISGRKPPNQPLPRW